MLKIVENINDVYEKIINIFFNFNFNYIYAE